jgi:phage FluMu protein Com
MRTNWGCLSGRPFLYARAEVTPVQAKLPLICAGCGRLICWARRANGHEAKCPQCGRVTVFTIRRGRVEKVLLPAKPKRQRARSGPPGRREMEQLMKSSRYPDFWRC